MRKSLTLCCMLVLLPAAGLAAIPQTISYQGLLQDASGVMVPDGNYGLTFKLYTVPWGGAALWTESQTLAVADGLFNAALGSVTPISLDFNSAYWLGITVQANPELTPRVALAASPYGLNADRLDGYNSNAFATAAHTHLLDSITDVNAPAPVTGQVLTFNAGNWVAQTPTAGDDWENSGSDIYRNTGRVGIGTSTPDRRLDVVASTSHAIKGEVTYVGMQNFIGVEGYSNPADGWGIGGYFEGGSRGVSGHASHEGSASSYGVYGTAFGTSGGKFGVYGSANGAGQNYGIWGLASGGTSNYAGYFSGNVHVNGTLSKSAGSFKIDHPLDPANRTLSHSFVESPDMKNIYDGTVVLGTDGSAWIELPAWFEALNRDVRYQLTCVGGFAPVYVADKITGNRFRVAGGMAGLEVCWQVTGIRQDAYANAHRIPVEEAKAAEERGRYLNAEAFGLPDEMGVDDAIIRRATDDGSP